MSSYQKLDQNEGKKCPYSPQITIEPIQGYCSYVCQSCSYAISEFYQYSEKVRHNQEVLNGNVTNFDATVDVKITIQSVMFKMLGDPGLSERTENSCKPKDEVSEVKNVPTTNPKITLERVNIETISDSKLPETTGPSDEADEPAKNYKETITELQQKRNQEDHLFNKHFRMICELCGTPAATFTALHSHFRKDHNRTGWIICCNTKLFCRSTMLDHIEFHANPDAFRCQICGNKYRHQVALNEHKLRKHSSEDQRPFKCDVCPQSFALKSDLTNHTIGHVKIQCPECKKFFINKRSYNVHMRTQHGDMDQSIVCTICEELFVTKKYFDRHMKEHMGIEVQRVQCGICQRSLKDKAVLREHMKMVHADGELKFQCDICLKKYRHYRALRSHIRHIHGEPMHECEFCGKKFNNAFSLKEHRTIHTGEILYACEYCGKRMKHKITLRRHIKRDHPAEWAQKRKTVRISEQF